MLKAVNKLRALRRNISSHRTNSASPSNSREPPTIIATPSAALADEHVKIKLIGLQPHQSVTLVANVDVDKAEFESRAVYQANSAGEVDSTMDSCLGGTFVGKEPMGLFWSLKSLKPDTIFYKKDVTTPFNVDIQVFDGVQEQGKVPGLPLISTVVERRFVSPGTTFIHVNEGGLSGTVFLPPGNGPFPSVIDVNGAFGVLNMARAALLSSQGYVTFALSYIHMVDRWSNKRFGKICNDYMKDAMEWFCNQWYVDESRLGLVGISYGGHLAFNLAAMTPKVKAVVSISGYPYVCGLTGNGTGAAYDIYKKHIWVESSDVYATDDGVVLSRAFGSSVPQFVPAWKHGAKILLISGGEDAISDPNYQLMWYDSVPMEYKDGVKHVNYPGAGHNIDVPNTPHTRATRIGRKWLTMADQIPDKYHDMPFLFGGYTRQHANAQEDSWRQLREFLRCNLNP